MCWYEQRSGSNFQCDNFLHCFLLRPSDNICMIRIAWGWIRQNLKRLIEIAACQIVRTSVQVFSSLTSNIFASSPDFSLIKSKVTSYGEVIIRMRNKCFRPYCIVPLAYMTTLKNKSRKGFIRWNRNQQLACCHADGTRMMSAIMFSGTFPMNGSDPYDLLLPNIAA